MAHNHPIPFNRRTAAQEKVFVDRKNNFFYVQRGIDKTPPGTKVEIITCNDSVRNVHGSIEKTDDYSLRNADGYFRNQLIAWSTDQDDLILFAIEHGWKMDHPDFDKLVQDFKD